MTCLENKCVVKSNIIGIGKLLAVPYFEMHRSMNLTSLIVTGIDRLLGVYIRKLNYALAQQVEFTKLSPHTYKKRVKL